MSEMNSGQRRQETQAGCFRRSESPLAWRRQVSGLLAYRGWFKRKGFSLIEMIGVVTVLAILAAVLAPVLIRRIDQTVLTKEVNEMGAISNALVMQIIRNELIPDQSTWASTAAGWMERPASQITTNARGFARQFVYDGGNAGNSWLQLNLPYDQMSHPGGTGTGTSPSGRIALISTIAKSLPNISGSLSSANFNSIWNASRGTVPSYLTAQGWTGNGYDLSIQRISIDPLFHHLVLVTRDDPNVPPFPGYSINITNAATTLPNTAYGLDSYFLHGTPVSLWVRPVSSPFPSITNTFILTQDISFTFDQGMWQSGLTGAGKDNSSTASTFGQTAKLFIQTDNVPGVHQGATAQSVLSAFYSYMYTYIIWANQAPHFQTVASSPGQQTDYVVLDALGHKSGGGNKGIIDGAAGGLIK